jgi:hypothetical protein
MSEGLSQGWRTPAEAAKMAYDIGLSPIPARRKSKSAAILAHPARSILRLRPDELDFNSRQNIALMGGYGGLVSPDIDEGGDDTRKFVEGFLGSPVAATIGRPGCWKLIYRMAGWSSPDSLEGLTQDYIAGRYAARDALNAAIAEAREIHGEGDAFERAKDEAEAQEKLACEACEVAFRREADPWIAALGLPRTRTQLKRDGMKIDLLSFYHLIIIPPSIHGKTEKPYRWDGEPLTKERWESAPLITAEQVGALCEAIQPRARPSSSKSAVTAPPVPRSSTGLKSELEAVKEMLDYIQQGHGEGEHRNRFKICVALAARYGDIARPIAERWYPGDNFEKCWQSAFKPYDGPKVGMGTLIKWAREGGWQGALLPNWPRVNKEGAPLRDSPRNVECLLAWIGVEARYDEFSGQIFMHGGDEPCRYDQQYLNKLHIEADAVYFPATKRTLAECVHSLAEKRRYHALREHLESFKHDGVERCETALIRHLGAEDTPYVRAVSRLFFAALARRVLDPGCKYDHMLVLDGEQNLGKSAFFEILAGPWHSSTLPIGADAQKVILETQGVWIAEHAELAGMRRKDVESVKEFITRREDKSPLKYQNEMTHRPRQFVLAGTTNDDRPLQDQTGDRRFLIVEVTQRLDFEKFKAARAQLLAEALLIAKSYGPLVLSPEVIPAAKEKQELARFRSATEERAEGQFKRMAFGQITKDDFYEACGLKAPVRDGEKRAVEHAAKRCGWYVTQHENRVRTDWGRVRVFKRRTLKGNAPWWRYSAVPGKVRCEDEGFAIQVETHHQMADLLGVDPLEDKWLESTTAHFTW